jgi:hypothetical protein
MLELQGNELVELIACNTKQSSHLKALLLLCAEIFSGRDDFQSSLTGLGFIRLSFPPLKRRAIFIRPASAGTGTHQRRSVQISVYQRCGFGCGSAALG